MGAVASKLIRRRRPIQLGAVASKLIRRRRRIQLDIIWRGCALPAPKKSPSQNELLHKQLEAGGDELTAVYAHLHESITVYAPNGARLAVPRTVALALESKDGSRLVQSAVGVASPEQRAALIGKWRGFVSCLATSKHGNFVIQKFFETEPTMTDSYQCIALEVLTDFTCIVGDKFGCRIVQRLLEHLDSSNKVRPHLVARILENASHLCWDDYGHFAVESLLEHGQASEHASIVQTLLLDAYGAYHGKGCFVVQKVFDLMLLPQVLPLLSLQPHEWNALCRWGALVATSAPAAPNA